MSKLAWYFTDGRKLRDGQPLIDGETYIYEGPVKMRDSGYHYSVEPLDALRYAPGLTLSRVEVDGIVEEQSDKGVCRSRKVIRSMDATTVVLETVADIVEHTVRKYYIGTSTAPMVAVNTVRAYLRGEATEEECRAASRAAARAAYAADAASDASAYAASYVADAASRAAARAARAAAYASYAADAEHAASAYATASKYASAYAASRASRASRAAANRLMRIRLKRAFGELT